MSTTNNELLEKLAELEHEQWVMWSKYIYEHYDVPKELYLKWKNHWIPYSELHDEVKEKDREWARKALDIIANFYKQ